MHAFHPPDPFNETTAGQLASLFDALSDPTRLRIIAALLDGEMNVGDLVAFIGLSKSAVSHQLAVSAINAWCVLANRAGKYMSPWMTITLPSSLSAAWIMYGMAKRIPSNPYR